MNSIINFRGLPQTLQRRVIEGTTASDIKKITMDAAQKAGIKPPLNITPKLIRENNADIFTRSGVISEEGAQKICEELKCKNTCTSMRDAIADFMKKHSDEELDYSKIV